MEPFITSCILAAGSISKVRQLSTDPLGTHFCKFLTLLVNLTFPLKLKPDSQFTDTFLTKESLN